MSDTPRTDEAIVGSSSLSDALSSRRSNQEFVEADFARDLEREIALVRIECEAANYVPGQWICPKCEFVLTTSIMHAPTGNVGANLANVTEPCPRCGDKLHRMTWKAHALDSRKTALSHMDYARQVEAERDALCVTRPYDCYWSRRALAAERKLEELSRGNNAPGEPKEETVKRRLLLTSDAAEGGNIGGTQPEVKSRIDAITAKMSSHSDPTRNGGSENVSLYAVYAADGVNKKWSTMTPCGQLSLTIDNPNAQGFIVKGKEYIVTIREAKPGE